MRIRIIVCVLFLLSFASGSIAQDLYTNFNDFKEAVIRAQAGDEIILAAGRYEAESITLESIIGTMEEPIVIRAEKIGADTLDNGTYFDFRNCSYITVQGFVINITEKATTFKLQASNNIRITQNVFNGEGEAYYKEEDPGGELERNSSLWISIQGHWDDDITMSHHNRIDHNLFMNKHTLGNMIRTDGTAELFVSQYDVIEYNHFYNMGPRAENEMEAVRLGWSAMSESDGYTRFTNNLFEACNGDPEIISVKCNKNTISHNTFRRCRGTLSLRHGNESVVEGNFFFGEGEEGTGGVRIYGSDHSIINNYFEGLTGTRWDAPITLTEGDAEEGSSGLTKHFRIERALIANNTLVNNIHGIEIGFDNNGNYSKPPRDVIMAYNAIVGDTNAFVKYINAPENMTWVSNIAYPSEDAFLGEGVSFTEDELKVLNPDLAIHDTEMYYKATLSSPDYIPSSEIAGFVTDDINGQLRSESTNYGADEYNTSSENYKPLSAEDVGPDVGEYLYVSDYELSFSVAGEEKPVSVQSNLSWEVMESIDWLSVDPSVGSGYNSFTISVSENLTGLIRKDTIIVSSTNAQEGTIDRTIVITQLDQEPPELSVSTSELNFSSAGGDKSFTISSNTEWMVSTDEHWTGVDLTAGSGNGSIEVSVEENTDLNSRSATILITDGHALTETILVSQEAFVGTEIKLTIVDAIASTEQNEPGKENIADNVYDGIFTNRWSGEGDGAYITLWLDSECKVSFVKVGLYKGNERNSMFDILSSADGTEYTELLMDITSEITSEPLVIYNFEDVDARYIRIVGHGNSTSSWNSYTEFEVWGWNLDDPLTVNNRNGTGSENYIFPNPANESINITDNQGADFLLFDLSGKLVLQLNTISNDQYITHCLERGMYIVVLRTDEVLKTDKLIIE